MNDHENELINPDEWTTRELIKHMYREQRAFRKEFQEHNDVTHQFELKTSKRLDHLEQINRDRETEQAVTKKYIRTLVWVGSALASVVGAILAAIARAVFEFYKNMQS